MRPLTTQDLAAAGQEQQMRLVSGPQGPHVVLDGRPVMLLCSGNYLGLSDHPRVREAAAEAALRWGVGAGSSRVAAGTMTIHRRLEERLADLASRQAALVFGSGFLASAGVISALAGPGDVVFSDEHNHPALVDGCQLSGAETFVYEHRDVEHLAWGIENVGGRGILIVSESVFSLFGDVAPLPELAELAERHRIRLMVDEAHAIGAIGPEGRGVVAQEGLEHQVDVLVGGLDNALGSSGAFVACDEQMSRYLQNAARTFIFSTAPSPPALAGALAAIELLTERPELVKRLQVNAIALGEELDRQGVYADGSGGHICFLTLGDAALTTQAAQSALERGVFAQALVPPAVPSEVSGLRLSVMASHRRDEVRSAARIVAQGIRNGLDRAEGRVEAEFFDLEAREPGRSTGVFDLEADERLAA